MAERRMFAKTIIDSDPFLDMPASTQNLYFHLAMRADDDGFVNSPKKIQRMVSASDDDLKLLVAKRFIIPFESGICVIKHWKIHNYIQSDRYKPTVYVEEKRQLRTKENRAYTLLDTSCIQNVSIVDAQVSIGKNSLELEKEKKSKTDDKSSTDLFFDSVWKIYPRHVNDRKSAVKKTRRQYLEQMGLNTVTKAIEAYLEKQKPDYRHAGNNFFNEIIDNFIETSDAEPIQDEEKEKPYGY